MTRARDFADVISGNFAIPSGSLGNAVPADGSITTAKLADDAITSAKIADDAVVSAAIADDAVVAAAIADDAVVAAAIADDAVTSAAIATNAVASDALNIVSSDLPSGTALQTVATTYTSRFITNSQSYVEVTGLTTSITPSSSSNKVLVKINVTFSAFGHGGFKVYRSQGGTDTLLSVGDANASQTNQEREVVHFYRTTGNSTTYDSESAAITILDTPSTTSAVSYKLFAGVPHSNTYYALVNYQYSEGNYAYSSTTISTMSLTEIAG